MALTTETVTINGKDYKHIFSDKWCEQGSKTAISSSGQVVKLLKSYKDTNYSIVSTGGTNNYGNTTCTARTVSQFAAYTGDDDSFNAGDLLWVAMGYIN